MDKNYQTKNFEVALSNFNKSPTKVNYDTLVYRANIIRKDSIETEFKTFHKHGDTYENYYEFVYRYINGSRKPKNSKKEDGLLKSLQIHFLENPSYEMNSYEKHLLNEYLKTGKSIPYKHFEIRKRVLWERYINKTFFFEKKSKLLVYKDSGEYFHKVLANKDTPELTAYVLPVKRQIKKI